MIRGIGGDRVQVLTDGLASPDASGPSEDHAVAVEPALAQQIEIVRGPATPPYGSGAAGGVVNVVTTRLHERARQEGSRGVIEGRGESALDEAALSGRLDAGVGRLQLHVDGSWRDTDDYSIPGFTESRRQRELDRAAGEEPSDERGTVEKHGAARSRAAPACRTWAIPACWGRLQPLRHALRESRVATSTTTTRRQARKRTSTRKRAECPST